MPIDIEQQVYDNARDINAVAKNVIELSSMMKGAEQRYIEDRQDVKEVIKSVAKLHDQINIANSIKEMVMEQKAEISAMRHDVKNIQQTQIGFSVFNEKLNDATSDIAALQEGMKTLQTIRDKFIGGTEALGIGAKIFWAIFGTAISASIVTGLYFALKFYIDHKDAAPITGF